MNKYSITLKNKKQKLWKNYVLTRSKNDYNKFVKCKKDLRSLTRSLRKAFEKKLAINSKNSPKPFWSYVKSNLKTRTKIPNLTKSDVAKACTSKEKADALNAYFGNVYKKETGELPQHEDYSGIPLTSIVITREIVLNSLNPGDPHIPHPIVYI